MSLRSLWLQLQRPGPLLLLVLAVGLYRYAAWGLAEGISLFSDEAQYWTWAQDLDWGYYSKPPLIAALIRFTTALAGSDAEWAIKLGAVLVYPLTTMLVYALGRSLYRPAVGRDAALLFLLMPAVSMSAVIISTDVLLLACWAAALLGFWRALNGNAWRDWFLIGLAAGLGLLSKYNMAFFAFAVVVFTLHPAERRLWLNPRLWVAGLLALLVLLPNLLWNLRHDFVTFRHHADISGLERALFHPEELLEFFGAQFLVFGPVSFGLLLAALGRWRLWREAPRETRLLLAFSAAPLLLMLSLALVSHAYANWGAPLYVAAAVLVAALMQSRPRWLQAALAVNLALGLVFYHSAALIEAAGLPLQKRYDLYHRVRGWDEVGYRMQRLLQEYPETRLLASDRKLLALLMYYARPLPEPRIWAAPGQGIANHYAMSLPLRGGDPGPFLWIRGDHPDAATLARFAGAERLPDLVVRPYAGLERRYQVWRVEGFRGYAD